jgi:K+-sensing histidine kinase KdpD
MNPKLPLAQFFAMPSLLALEEKTILYRYGIVTVAIISTLALRLMLGPVLEYKNHFVIYMPAVILSTWYGGLLPGILAFLLGGIAGTIFFSMPAFAFHWSQPSSFLGLIFYFLSSGFILFLTQAQRNAQYEAEKKQHQFYLLDTQRNNLLLVAQRARNEADRANAMKTQFVAMVMHELRTPLTSIKGFSSTLLAEDVVWSVEDQKRFLTLLESEADKLSELIDQLLDLTQVQTGNLQIVLQSSSLTEIIALARPTLENIARHHHLILDIPQNLPMIMADSKRLTQVFQNLVGNAAKYSPKQTDITIQVKQRDYGIQVAVEDTGISIPIEHHQVVFEPFRQLNDTTWQTTKGSGLGLALCKSIIEAHDGKIWIGKKPSPGTVICFTLPIGEHNLN